MVKKQQRIDDGKIHGITMDLREVPEGIWTWFVLITPDFNRLRDSEAFRDIAILQDGLSFEGPEWITIRIPTAQAELYARGDKKIWEGIRVCCRTEMDRQNLLHEHVIPWYFTDEVRERLACRLKEQENDALSIYIMACPSPGKRRRAQVAPDCFPLIIN